MILYKYYDANSGLEALKSRKLGFRTPANFNDPFELTALFNNGEGMSSQPAYRRQIEELKNDLVILCLTRSPMNPLMWAHYGKEHTGIVIGYDVSSDFLSSPEYSLIPVGIGDVIYTQTKSPVAWTPQNVDSLHRVYLQGLGVSDTPTHDQQVLARRLLLTKHAIWGYEEEVRIVKLLDSLFEGSQEWQQHPYRTIFHVDNLPSGLHLFNQEVPIMEVYLGARNSMLDVPETLWALEDLSCPVFQLEVDDTSWQLVKKTAEMPPHHFGLSR